MEDPPESRESRLWRIRIAILEDPRPADPYFYRVCGPSVETMETPGIEPPIVWKKWNADCLACPKVGLFCVPKGITVRIESAAADSLGRFGWHEPVWCTGAIGTSPVPYGHVHPR